MRNTVANLSVNLILRNSKNNSFEMFLYLNFVARPKFQLVFSKREKRQVPEQA